ncbi:hypothetical protein VARIO8X_90459 [Burkholderiales bacterium 8X]|nr:hypothetical protein VARIO8X_90459 [Burkholderiales bacterium 8X]
MMHSGENHENDARTGLARDAVAGGDVFARRLRVVAGGARAAGGAGRQGGSEYRAGQDRRGIDAAR